MQFSAVDWQKEIYLNGFSGSRPVVPIQFENLERAAAKVLSPRAFAYVAGGAGNETTMVANRSSFDKVSIVPRMLKDVAIRDTSIRLFGKQLSSPFLLSPVGVLELVHQHAELLVAKA